MAIFHSYFSHYQRGILFHRLVIAMMVRHHSYVSQNKRVNPIKSHDNHHFPIVFLWFSHGFHPHLATPALHSLHLCK